MANLTKAQVDAENAVLRDMVNRYAQHLRDCPVVTDSGLCACGYYDCLLALRDAVRGKAVKLPPMPMPRDAQGTL